MSVPPFSIQCVYQGLMVVTCKSASLSQVRCHCIIASCLLRIFQQCLSTLFGLFWFTAMQQTFDCTSKRDAKNSHRPPSAVAAFLRFWRRDISDFTFLIIYLLIYCWLYIYKPQTCCGLLPIAYTRGQACKPPTQTCNQCEWPCRCGHTYIDLLIYRFYNIFTLSHWVTS